VDAAADYSRTGEPVTLMAPRQVPALKTWGDVTVDLSKRLDIKVDAMAQTLVQFNTHKEIRGRRLGLFNMASLGLRAFSGITVGLIGRIIGVHWSLALSALVLLAAITCLLLWIGLPRPAK
jgi:hypothetical protein